MCQQKCGSVSQEIPLSHFTQNCNFEQLREVRKNINAICYRYKDQIKVSNKMDNVPRLQQKQENGKTYIQGEYEQITL